MEQWVSLNWSCDKRDDGTWLNSDLARIGELGRCDVSHHDWTQRKVVDQVWDPEWCNRLMVFTSIDRHLHNPWSKRDEIIVAVHVVRLMFEWYSIQQRNLNREMWAIRRMKLIIEENYVRHGQIIPLYRHSWVWIYSLCANDRCDDVRMRMFTCRRAESLWLRDVLSFSARLWGEATNLESIKGKLRKIILYWSRGTQNEMRWRDSFQKRGNKEQIINDKESCYYF